MTSISKGAKVGKSYSSLPKLMEDAKVSPDELTTLVKSVDALIKAGSSNILKYESAIAQWETNKEHPKMVGATVAECNEELQHLNKERENAVQTIKHLTSIHRKIDSIINHEPRII